MSQFKSIDLSKINYEAVRNFHAINRAGFLSIEYKYTLACLWPIQNTWNNFETWRQAKKIIAQCKWTIGQLVNVLNYFFDSEQQRIFINQQRLLNVFVPIIAYESVVFAPEISLESEIYVPGINDPGTVLAQVKINVPSDIYNDSIIMNQLVSIVEQIKIGGFTYEIVEIV